MAAVVRSQGSVDIPSVYGRLDRSHHEEDAGAYGDKKDQGENDKRSTVAEKTLHCIDLPNSRENIKRFAELPSVNVGYAS
jgi:hypothetical protein